MDKLNRKAHNSVLMIGFESGDIKFLDTNQVKLTRNDTLGIGLPPGKYKYRLRFVPTSGELSGDIIPSDQP